MIAFPNPFKIENTFFTENEHLAFTVNSGKNAIRIALRSFNLPANSKIAIPAFSCNAVYQAVTEEGYMPVFCDLKSDNTYWAEYNTTQIINEQIKVLILTHLYGFIHPDTTALIEFCRKNNIKIIHDAAQSFGIDESVFDDDIIVYSFSSGKSSTAAGGGEICNLNKFNVLLKEPSAIQKLKKRVFFNARYVDYKFPNLNAKLNSLFQKISSNETSFLEMSVFQKSKALQAKYIVKHFSNERKERYNILKQSILANNKFKIAFDDTKGIYFKMVIFVPNQISCFTEYLDQNSVIYYRLSKDINVTERGIETLSLFTKNYFNFVEISTERTIDLKEIKRIAGLLANYK